MNLTSKSSSPSPARVLYVGAFRFPNGDAGAQRVLGIGKAIRGAGKAVEFCGWTQKKDGLAKTPETGSFLDFRFENAEEFRTGREGPIRRFFHHLREGSATVKWVRNHSRAGDVIIAYNWFGLQISRLVHECRARSQKIIVDSVEWYAPHQCPGGRVGLVRWEVEYSLRRTFFRADGVIAISSFLEKHFSKGVRTIRVPPLIDVTDKKWLPSGDREQKQNSITIGYCGFPARKDSLSPLFTALRQINNEPGKKIGLILIGPKSGDVAHVIDPELLANGTVTCLGRLPHEEALSALSKCDYSALIRPNERYANAGFSTKFVESLAVGTPPFCNLTSDIGLVSQDGIDSIHLSSDSPIEILRGLRRLRSIGPEEHGKLRVGAVKTAEREFDWRNFSKPLGEFIDLIGR